ncbi:hypothetical protein GCM10008940_33640 [Microbulbifer agarilyticus]
MRPEKKKLIADLKEASSFLREEGFDCLWSSFDRSEDFADELDRICLLLEKEGFDPFSSIKCFYLRKKAKYLWFTPTFDWDDTVSGERALRLGNDLYENL